jgi:hypothetical protein
MTFTLLSAPLAGVAAAILALMAVIHMYWALGGSIGAEALVPQTTKGPLFRLTAPVTLVIALIFVFAADLMLARLGVATARIPAWGLDLACGALALAFLARAIGDFRYVGFFKRERRSRFARLDTAVYSPVSLFLAVAIGINAL